MAVIPADLLQPVGKVDPSLFPGEASDTLPARLQAYIDEGVAKQAAPVSDGATKAWAMFRVYDAVYVRMTTQAATLDFEDQGSRTFLKEQIANVRSLRDEALREFDVLVVPVLTRVARTTNVPIDYVW